MSPTQQKYDLIVIGLGSAGLTLSISMAKAGFKVLGIDKSDSNIGGDCLNYGCIPSKAVIHISRLVHKASESQEYGLEVSGEVDIKKIMDYVAERQDVLREHENADYLRNEGMDVALGSARFEGSHQVRVGEKVFAGKKIAICTGSSARMLRVPGIEQVKQVYTNESVFNMQELPRKFLFIGAGPIACELGQAFQRLGSQVTMVNLGKRILERSPEKMAAVVASQLEREGISMIHEASVSEFPSPTTALVKHKDGQKETLEFDAVMVAIGQVSDFGEMNLANAGINTDERGGLIVNDKLQTSQKHIYVAGDAAGKGQFSHLAAEHASIILMNFFSPIKSKTNRKTIPAVTFTDPELATFGFNKEELEKKGIAFQTIEHDFRHGHRAAVSDYMNGKMEVYLKKGRTIMGEKLLGGTIVAPRAGEMVQEFIMAQSRGMSFLGIMGTIHPYPSATNDAKAAFLDHVIAKIGPGLKKILRWLF